MAKQQSPKYWFGILLDSLCDEVVAMARPTKSRALYAQAIGRGTRPLMPPDVDATAEQRRAAIAASSKPGMTVLDFTGNAGRHKLITTADILGGKYDDEVVAATVNTARKNSGPVDMPQELAKADDAEKIRRKKITAKATFTREAIDPFDVFDIAPGREPGWHQGRKPSAKMVAMLDRNGIATADLSFHKAKRLIGEIIDRRKKGLCSFEQAKLLAKFGEDSNVGFQEASQKIDAIRQNGWKPLPPVETNP